MANQEEQGAAGTNPATGGEPDYKALYEKAAKDLEAAQAQAEKWKGLSRKNEDRAKSNAGAAKDLEEASAQLADLAQRLEAIEGENAALKASAARSALVASVSKATGVPEDIVSMLSASDEKALTEAAKAIADAYKAPGGAPFVPEAGRFPGDLGAAAEKTTVQQFGKAFDELLGL